MAKKRWATFSVADHLDVASLVPDVLLFDRLAFPYPADEPECRLWQENGWDPKLLDYCLLKLADVAIPVEWGQTQRQQFRTNMQQAEVLEQLTFSPAAWIHDDDPHQKWETAKQMTRGMVADMVQEKRGNDFWVMPCYRSRDAFLRDQSVTIAATNRKSRRQALALLVGQEMSVPHHADPKIALDLAVDLARDASYQKSRRDLYNWQEDVIQREQSSQDDATDLADLISELDSHVLKLKSKTRKQWLFFALKRIVNAPEALHNPLSAGSAIIESVEFLSDRKREFPPGALAAFHHVRQRVIDPSMPRRPRWKFWRR